MDTRHDTDARARDIAPIFMEPADVTPLTADERDTLRTAFAALAHSGHLFAPPTPGEIPGPLDPADPGLGVVVSIDPALPAGAGFHISITRPGHPPSDDDIAVVRIAVFGPGSHVRIVTPATSMLRGQIIHLDEEPGRYDPPDAPWWTQEEFAAVAAQMAKETGIPAKRARVNMEHLQRLGLARIERRWDPDHGELVRLDLRPIQWRQERRQRRQDAGQSQGEENSV